MSKKEIGWAALGGLLLLEAVTKSAISKTAAQLGVNGAVLLLLGFVATAVVSQLD
jgi:hypothetical protein